MAAKEYPGIMQLNWNIGTLRDSVIDMSEEEGAKGGGGGGGRAFTTCLLSQLSHHNTMHLYRAGT